MTTCGNLIGPAQGWGSASLSLVIMQLFTQSWMLCSIVLDEDLTTG